MKQSLLKEVVYLQIKNKMCRKQVVKYICRFLKKVDLSKKTLVKYIDILFSKIYNSTKCLYDLVVVKDSKGGEGLEGY